LDTIGLTVFTTSPMTFAGLKRPSSASVAKAFTDCLSKIDQFSNFFQCGLLKKPSIHFSRSNVLIATMSARNRSVSRVRIEQEGERQGSAGKDTINVLFATPSPEYNSGGKDNHKTLFKLQELVFNPLTGQKQNLGYLFTAWPTCWLYVMPALRSFSEVVDLMGLEPMTSTLQM
jgi:hypothetical protein